MNIVVPYNYWTRDGKISSKSLSLQQSIKQHRNSIKCAASVRHAAGLDGQMNVSSYFIERHTSVDVLADREKEEWDKAEKSNSRCNNDIGLNRLRPKRMWEIFVLRLFCAYLSDVWDVLWLLYWANELWTAPERFRSDGCIYHTIFRLSLSSVRAQLVTNLACKFTI